MDRITMRLTLEGPGGSADVAEAVAVDVKLKPGFGILPTDETLVEIVSGMICVALMEWEKEDPKKIADALRTVAGPILAKWSSN